MRQPDTRRPARAGSGTGQVRENPATGPAPHRQSRGTARHDPAPNAPDAPDAPDAAGDGGTRELVWQVAAAVPDPELPVLTIADLGVLRDVTVDPDGRVEVTVTPTYSGCPAMDAIRADLRAALARNGFAEVTVRTVLSPPWTTDWISESGRRALAEHGIAPPGPRTGPVLVGLGVRCPRCGSGDTRLISRFGSTACTSLHACNACLEPFDHVKAI